MNLNLMKKLKDLTNQPKEPMVVCRIITMNHNGDDVVTIVKGEEDLAVQLFSQALVDGRMVVISPSVGEFEQLLEVPDTGLQGDVLFLPQLGGG